MAILDLSPDVWRSALDIPEGRQPVALVLEGTWWRARATQARLARLTAVRETSFPDIYLGDCQGVPIAYCCAYGAARAVEPAHIFAQIGTPLVIQIGSCGAMDPALQPGTVMVPDLATGRDGVSHLYHAGGAIALDAPTGATARALMSQMNIPAARGSHLTWPSLFAQSDAICAAWGDEGFRTVDMETAAVAAAACRFGAKAVALLTVWDALSAGKSFLDPLTPAQTKAFARSDAAIFEVALELAKGVGLARAA